jgi:hypothetical protein
MPSYGGGGEGGGDGVGGGPGSGGYGVGNGGGAAGSGGYGGVGTDPSVASTNPTTSTPTGLPSMPGWATAGLSLAGLGPAATAYNGIAAVSHMSTTTSDISGNKTQNNNGPSGPTGGGGGGGPFDGNLSNILGIAGGINGIMNQSGGGSNSYQNAADPFAPYRSGLAASYNQALTQGNQTDITKMPGYSQFQSGVMNPALEATQGKLAASGMSMSGTESQSLNKVAQQGYYGFMTDYMNRLAQGSGAVNNPAQAAGMGFQQQNQNQQATMQGIGAIGQGLSGLFGGGSGNYSPDMTGFQSPYQAPSYTPSFSTPDTSGLGSGGYVPPNDPGSIDPAWFSF